MFAKFICWLLAPLFRSQQFRDLLAADVARYLAIPQRKELVSEIVHEVAEFIDIERLGLCVPLRRLADQIVDGGHFDYDVIAERAAKAIQPADVARYVDLDDIAERAAEHVDLDSVAEKIDVSSVAENIEKGRDFVKSVAEEISLSDLAEELDYSTLTREIDIDWLELASNLDSNEIAQNIDCNEIASCLDLSDLAGEFDMSTLAEEISVSDIAGELDYTELARALLQQFVDADEARRKVEVRPSAS